MIYLILLLAVLLRLINLNQSLWWDEAINVVYARSTDFWWYITQYSVGDFHPPGWFAVLWLWGHLFGFSEVMVRLPPVILGTATAAITFLLGKELFSKKVGLIAAFFLAIAPLHIYYSQEARMYALSAFSVTLSFYFLNRLISKKKWSGLGLIISLVLVLSSDYLAYLVIPAQIIYLIWVKKINKAMLASFIFAGIIFLPWFTIFPTQLKTGIEAASGLPGWASVVGSSFKDLFLIPAKTLFGRITFSDKNLYMVISGFAGIILGGIFFYGVKKIDNATKFLISWIFIPVILALLISFFVPVLAYFRIIFILPAFYLILAKSLENLAKKITLPLTIFICLISIVSLLVYYFNPKFQREDWRGAVNFISRNLDSQTGVVFENNEIPAPVQYYRNDLSNFYPGLSKNLADNLVDKKKVFLFEYLIDIYDPRKEVEQKLKDLNFIETRMYDFNGVGFVRFYIKL